MQDKDIDPDDYEEDCPDCGAELDMKGDKWEGSLTCSKKCGYEKPWNNLEN